MQFLKILVISNFVSNRKFSQHAKKFNEAAKTIFFILEKPRLLRQEFSKYVPVFELPSFQAGSRVNISFGEISQKVLKINPS